MGGFSEVARQVVHVAVGGFALLLRFLTWPQAAILAIVALAFNVVVLPRIGPGLFRPGDLGGIMRSGIAIYPLAVLGLVLCFPRRPDLAAVAWAILAAGDGCATLVGAHVRTAPLPWNRAKSAGGLIAFIVAAGAAGAAVEVWTARALLTPPLPWFLIGAPIIAALVAAFVETIPVRLNDNLSVPASAALVLWSLSFVDGHGALAARALFVDRLWLACFVNVVFATAAWRVRAITGAGATTGAVIGIIVWSATGAAGWTMLFATFVAAAITTRLGHRRKRLLGIAEERDGRRGPGNAIANTGLAAWAALIASATVDPTIARIAMVAALTTAASDTVASEIGKAWGTTTVLVTSGRRVPPGTSGAVSVEGTAALAGAAFLLASLGVGLGLAPASALLPIAIAAVAASFAEGVLGATLEAPGILNNDLLNFVNSAIGAGLAMLFWMIR
jgi:uncharacterized protein (TIGR00297 family)